MTDPSWDEFRQRQQGSAEPSPEQQKLHELCAHVFTSPPGRELMALLRKVTIECRTRPAAPEAELREIEAMRRFVLDLERWRDAGIAAQRKPKPAT